MLARGRHECPREIALSDQWVQPTARWGESQRPLGRETTPARARSHPEFPQVLVLLAQVLLLLAQFFLLLANILLRLANI